MSCTGFQSDCLLIYEENTLSRCIQSFGAFEKCEAPCINPQISLIFKAKTHLNSNQMFKKILIFSQSAQNVNDG